MFNSKGDFRVADILLFLFFMILVGFFVKLGSGILFQKGIETNSIEANIIIDKLSLVVSFHKSTEELFSDSFNVFSEGDFDKDIIENGNYFFGIEIVDSLEFSPLTYGNNDFYVECGLLESFADNSFKDRTVCESGDKELPSCCIKEVQIDSQTVRLMSAVRSS